MYSDDQLQEVPLLGRLAAHGDGHDQRRLAQIGVPVRHRWRSRSPDVGGRNAPTQIQPAMPGEQTGDFRRPYPIRLTGVEMGTRQSQSSRRIQTMAWWPAQSRERFPARPDDAASRRSLRDSRDPAARKSTRIRGTPSPRRKPHEDVGDLRVEIEHDPDPDGVGWPSGDLRHLRNLSVTPRPLPTSDVERVGRLDPRHRPVSGSTESCSETKKAAPSQKRTSPSVIRHSDDADDSAPRFISMKHPGLSPALAACRARRTERPRPSSPTPSLGRRWGTGRPVSMTTRAACSRNCRCTSDGGPTRDNLPAGPASYQSGVHPKEQSASK